MKTIVLAVALFLSIHSIVQQEALPAFSSNSKPADWPVLFAPGIISDEYGNRDMAISPSGNEMFYTLQYLGGRGFSSIMHVKKLNGKWSKPEVASFSGRYNDLEPAFSPDGSKLYFVSNRPLSDTTTKTKDYDIWFIEKKNNQWSVTKNAGTPINSGKDEFYPSVTKSGNIYFTKVMGENDEDIVVCKFKNNKYDTAVSLPDAINSKGAEFNAFVDPDEEFILFTGYKRKGNYGSGDLFISFRNKQNSWSEAKNLGENINGAGLTYCPYVSPDKKQLFFSSSRNSFKAPFSTSQKIKSLAVLAHSPLNGWDNIYWMNANKILVAD